MRVGLGSAPQRHFMSSYAYGTIAAITLYTTLVEVSTSLLFYF